MQFFSDFLKIKHNLSISFSIFIGDTFYWLSVTPWVCLSNYITGVFLTVFVQNVHHAGEPMPGEEQEDIVMTSTQSNILNISCPLSGKPITELAEPVRRYQILQIYPRFSFLPFCSLDCYFPRCNHFGCQLYFNWKKCVFKYHLKGHMLFMQVLEYDGDIYLLGLASGTSLCPLYE